MLESSTDVVEIINAISMRFYYDWFVGIAPKFCLYDKNQTYVIAFINIHYIS